MNKTKKLLSVILAVLMALSSMAIMASAANVPGTQSKLKYDTVADLESIGAYDSYGRATRFTTDERLSIFLDFLDKVLEKANINLGKVVDISALGAVIEIDLRSINALLKSIDSVAGVVDQYQGVLGGTFNSLWFSKNEWKRGMQRENITTQGEILTELTKLLNKNADAVATIVKNRDVNWGPILKNVGAIKSLMPTVKEYLGDVPGLIKGLIFPLLARWDDNQARIDLLSNTAGDGGVASVLNDYLFGMLTKDVSITTYKEDANGECISVHTLPFVEGKPTVPAGGVKTRHVFVKNAGDNSITRWHYDKKLNTYVEEKEAYERVMESEGVYCYTRPVSNENLVWYVDGTPALHSLSANGGVTADQIDITTKSAAELFYFFIPYLFKDLAVTPANGSLKKEIAWFFGARNIELLGTKGTAEGDKKINEIRAELDSVNAEAINTFFDSKAPAGIFTYSDYAVFEDTTQAKRHFWRYGDDFYEQHTEGINPYFNIINWDYKLDSAFLDAYMPQVSGETVTPSLNGYDSLLRSLNDIIGEIVEQIFVRNYSDDAGHTFRRPRWKKGGNENLVNNVLNYVQAIFGLSPESIFGSNYKLPERYYDLIMTAEGDPDRAQKVLIGAACTLVPMIMPQLILPTGDTFAAGGANEGTKVGAILAAVVRELASEFVPEKNYDAWIYSDYASKTFLKGKDNAYWLDVALSIGTDIGFKYLVSVMDIGEDDKASFAGAHWTKDAKKYTEADLKVGNFALWEARIDYLFDWALCDKDYGFKFASLLNVGTTKDGASPADFSAKLATVEDPFTKLENAIRNIVVDNTIANAGDTALYKLVNVDVKKTGWLKKLLKEDFILAIANLDLGKIVGTGEVSDGANDGFLYIPQESALKKANVLSQIVKVVRDLLNGLLRYTADNRDVTTESANLIPTSDSSIGGNVGYKAINTVDDIFTQEKLAGIVKSLFDHLTHAYGHGLLDPVLPIINMILGWKTTGAEFKNPYITIADTATGSSNFLANNGNIDGTVTVSNDIGGMLLKHGADSDKEYIVRVTGVSTDSNDYLVDFKGQVDIRPWQNAKFYVKGAYKSDTPIAITVNYLVLGRDGKQIGKEHNLTTYTYVTNNNGAVPTTSYDQRHVEIGSKWSFGLTPQPTPNYYVVHNFNEVKSLVNGIGHTTKNDSENWDGGFIWANDCVAPTNMDPIFTFDTSFVKYPGRRAKFKPTEEEAQNTAETGVIGKNPETGTIFPYSFNTKADTTKYESGPKKLNLGSYKITWYNNVSGNVFSWNRNDGYNNHETYDIFGGDIYVLDDQRLIDTFNRYKGLKREDFVAGANAEWAAFQTAIKAAAEVAIAPFTVEKFNNGTYNTANIDKLVKDVTDAVEALVKAGYEVAGSASLEAALQKAEPVAGTEANYHDYDLYEFFKYQGNRNDTRWRIGAYVRPDKEFYPYIASNANFGNDNIQAAIAAEANATIKQAIKGSLTQPTDEQKAQQLALYNNWKAPSYTDMENDDLASKLVFTKNHLTKLESTKESLNIELTWMNEVAKNDAAKYSKASFDNFKAQLDKANDLTLRPDPLRSEVFEAKWNVMVAYRSLVPAALSCDESQTIEGVQGAPYDKLKDLIKEAQGILNGTPSLAPNAGVTLDAALGRLITACGYETKDGVQLYPNSAMAFVKSDKIWSKNEQQRIDALAKELQAAIDLFAKALADIVGKPDADTNPQVQDTFLIGMEIGGQIQDFFQKADGQAISTSDITANIAGYVNGTGATVKVNEHTYTLVIFGDFNGDGAVDSFDAIEAAKDADAAPVDSAEKKAVANLDSTGNTTGAEAYAKLTAVAQGKALVDQNTGVAK